MSSLYCIGERIVYGRIFVNFTTQRPSLLLPQATELFFFYFASFCFKKNYFLCCERLLSELYTIFQFVNITFLVDMCFKNTPSSSSLHHKSTHSNKIVSIKSIWQNTIWQTNVSNFCAPVSIPVVAFYFTSGVKGFHQ